MIDAPSQDSTDMSAVEKLALQLCVTAMEAVTKSGTADPVTMMMLHAAGFERAAEIMQGKAEVILRKGDQ